MVENRKPPLENPNPNTPAPLENPPSPTTMAGIEKPPSPPNLQLSLALPKDRSGYPKPNPPPQPEHPSPPESPSVQLYPPKSPPNSNPPPPSPVDDSSVSISLALPDPPQQRKHRRYKTKKPSAEAIAYTTVTQRLDMANKGATYFWERAFPYFLSTTLFPYTPQALCESHSELVGFGFVPGDDIFKVLPSTLLQHRRFNLDNNEMGYVLFSNDATQGVKSVSDFRRVSGSKAVWEGYRKAENVYGFDDVIIGTKTVMELAFPRPRKAPVDGPTVIGQWTAEVFTSAHAQGSVVVVLKCRDKAWNDSELKVQKAECKLLEAREKRLGQSAIFDLKLALGDAITNLEMCRLGIKKLEDTMADVGDSSGPNAPAAAPAPAEPSVNDDQIRGVGSVDGAEVPRAATGVNVIPHED